MGERKGEGGTGLELGLLLGGSEVTRWKTHGKRGEGGRDTDGRAWTPASTHSPRT